MPRPTSRPVGAASDFDHGTVPSPTPCRRPLCLAPADLPAAFPRPDEQQQVLLELRMAPPPHLCPDKASRRLPHATPRRDLPTTPSPSPSSTKMGAAAACTLRTPCSAATHSESKSAPFSPSAPPILAKSGHRCRLWPPQRHADSAAESGQRRALSPPNPASGAAWSSSSGDRRLELFS